MNGTGINCMATSGTSIFIGTDKGVYLSTNNGIAWTPVNNGLGANSNMQTLVVNGTTIYAGSTNNGHGVFESTNNGANWTPIAPLYSFYPYAMAIIDTNIFAGCIFEGIYYSHNNGSNWIKVDSDLPDNITVYSMINIGTTVMAGTDSGVYISSNYGISWQEFNNGLGLYRGVTALGINDTTIYAGISGDLYKISSKILGIEQIEKNKEAINIYPNPSNGIFTLQFLGDVSPSLNSHNIVEVYNVLGEKVSSISSQVDENIINLSNQPNGVYLYRVVSENGDLAGEGKIVVQR
jgi:ligand-binding sensor domain-containing protein